MIITKEKNFWVLDKPPGMSAHNGTKDNPDLLMVLKQKYPQYHFTLPHRLDKETSGLILACLDPEVTYEIQGALEAETSHKIYTAVLRGKLESSEGSWNWALSDKAEGRKNPQGLLKDRKPCLTHYKTLEKNQYFTMVQCEIETGRQHQIRKHAALAKHPLVGDPRYNDPKYNEKISDLYKTDRLFLHATQLRFKHGAKKYEFNSHLPKEFKRIFS